MEQLLEGIPNVAVLLDDILVTGRTRSAHISNLREVLVRLQRAGIKLKSSKCQFLQPMVPYLGHRIDRDGVHPSEEKVEAIKNSPPPRNARELRSLMGLINFYGPFMEHLQGIAAPLHRLNSPKVPWRWTQVEADCLQRIKNMLSTEAALEPFDPSKPLVLACDASDVGLGAVLMHRMPSGELKPIAYASRKLRGAELHYSTTDKEAAALIFGTRKFRRYVLGRQFTLETDHKPLEGIFGEKRDLSRSKVVSNRRIRWASELMEYSFDLLYRDGKSNTLADFLSRFPVWERERLDELSEQNEARIRAIQLESIELSEQVLREKTSSDSTLQLVKRFITQGWPAKVDDVEAPLRPFWHKRDELTVEDGIVMRADRLVIPASLQGAVARELHRGHPGIDGMRKNARALVWWPELDKHIEECVRHCSHCKSNRGNVAEAPLFPWDVPVAPWERLHLDFAGPFCGRMWLLGVDAYSKWPEIGSMRSATAAKTISLLRDWFARFGIPKEVVTDNGLQFTANEFEVFCAVNGIKHIRSTEYHPKTNGLAERFVQTFKHRSSYAAGEESDVDKRVANFLLSYRNTPHSTTGRSPAEALLKRRLPTKLDRMRPDPRRRMLAQQHKQKILHDKSAKQRDFETGDEVWVRAERQYEKPPWKPGIVIAKTAALSYNVSVAGEVKRKHADQLRPRHGALCEFSASEASKPAPPGPLVPPSPPVWVGPSASPARSSLELTSNERSNAHPTADLPMSAPSTSTAAVPPSPLPATPLAESPTTAATTSPANQRPPRAHPREPYELRSRK